MATNRVLFPTSLCGVLILRSSSAVRLCRLRPLTLTLLTLIHYVTPHTSHSHITPGVVLWLVAFLVSVIARRCDLHPSFPREGCERRGRLGRLPVMICAPEWLAEGVRLGAPPIVICTPEWPGTGCAAIVICTQGVGCRVCRVLSCHVTPRRVASCHLRSHHVAMLLPCHVRSCCLLSCRVAPCRVAKGGHNTLTQLSHSHLTHIHAAHTHTAHVHTIRVRTAYAHTIHTDAPAQFCLPAIASPISSTHPRLLLKLQMRGYPVLLFFFSPHDFSDDCAVPFSRGFQVAGWTFKAALHVRRDEVSLLLGALAPRVRASFHPWRRSRR